YYVKRTSNRMLPVYSEVRNSGTRRLTIIQRIEGDSQKLQQDLAKTFKGTQVWVKPTNGHVILKGRYGRYVKSWLTARGF
ncbi:MAG: ribosomal protein L49/IMG2, partial [Piptocephalis tieghemiana]